MEKEEGEDIVNQSKRQKKKKEVKISGMAFLCTLNYEVFFRAQVILGGFLRKILYFIKFLKSYFLNFSWKAVF